MAGEVGWVLGFGMPRAKSRCSRGSRHVGPRSLATGSGVGKKYNDHFVARPLVPRCWTTALLDIGLLIGMDNKGS